ncbi:MAG TPA: adenylate kinase [Mycobacterium sp.]
MNRVVVLGRGGAGKSALAARLGVLTGLPVIELDKHFWSRDFAPLAMDQWNALQRNLISAERWILDGDLGPYDAPELRLNAADTVIVLDFPLWRCARRAARRSRENFAFWRWLISYRRRSLPTVLTAIAVHARDADVYLLRRPRDVQKFLARVNQGRSP